MTLRHTSLPVSDVEETVAFYEDLVGYEVVRSFESDGVENVFVGEPDSDAEDDAAVQLVAVGEPVDTGDFEHVALTTDDVDAAVADLDDDMVDDGPTTMEDLGLRVAFLEDPDGWGIELVEEL
jgi:lactoylglutathione lyase